MITFTLKSMYISPVTPLYFSEYCFKRWSFTCTMIQVRYSFNHFLWLSLHIHTNCLLSLFHDSPHPWRDDRGWGPEIGETERTLGDDTELPGLHRHGRVLFPRCPRQPSCHGLQVLAVPLGAGCAASHPVGAVGLPSGHVPGALGQAPPNRYGVRLCAWHAPF